MIARYATSTLLLIASLAARPAFSSDEENDLALFYGGELDVSVATGMSKPLHLAPAVTSVITAEEMAAWGATDLDQALERVPGLHVGASFNRLNALYSIRGIHTGQNPQVLMLIDGLPITQFTTGGRPNTFRLPVAAIARVEVMRGPGSAIYGADAYAGVINVITKRAGEIGGGSLGLGGGSFSTSNAWAQYGEVTGQWEVAASVQWLKSAGDEGRVVPADLQSSLDAGFGTHASRAPAPLSTRYDILDTHLRLSHDRWDLAFWGWRQFNGGVGPGAAQALDPEGRTDVEKYLIDLTYGEEWSPQWEVTSRLTYQYLRDANRFTILPAGATVAIGADGNLFTPPNGACGPCLVNFPQGVIGMPTATDHSLGIELTGVYRGWERHTLRLSGGAVRERELTSEAKNFGPGVIDGTQPVAGGQLTDVSGTPYVFMMNQERDLWFASLQDGWLFAPDWELTAGVRHDHYSDFGSTTNPRVALVWSVLRDLTAKVLYGRAFRAPSFSELYFINNPALLGNPALKPETIDTGEVVFDWRPGFTSRVALSLFRYRANDLIDFVADPATGAKVASNTPGQDGQGFELESDWSPSPTLRLFGSYALQESKYVTDGATVPKAPGRAAQAGVEWEFLPSWKSAILAHYIADRRRASGDLRQPVADYTLAHLTLRHLPAESHWSLSARVGNLFDTRAYEPSDPSIPGDYPLAGRSFYAEWRYDFR